MVPSLQSVGDSCAHTPPRTAKQCSVVPCTTMYTQGAKCHPVKLGSSATFNTSCAHSPSCVCPLCSKQQTGVITLSSLAQLVIHTPPSPSPPPPPPCASFMASVWRAHHAPSPTTWPASCSLCSCTRHLELQNWQQTRRQRPRRQEQPPVLPPPQVAQEQEPEQEQGQVVLHHSKVL